MKTLSMTIFEEGDKPLIISIVYEVQTIRKQV